MVKSCRIRSMVVPIFIISCNTPIEYPNVPTTSLCTVVLALKAHCAISPAFYFFVHVIAMPSITCPLLAINCLDKNDGIILNSVVI